MDRHFAIWQLANPSVYVEPEPWPAGSFYLPQNTVRRVWVAAAAAAAGCHPPRRLRAVAEGHGRRCRHWLCHPLAPLLLPPPALTAKQFSAAAAA